MASQPAQAAPLAYTVTAAAAVAAVVLAVLVVTGIDRSPVIRAAPVAAAPGPAEPAAATPAPAATAEPRAESELSVSPARPPATTPGGAALAGAAPAPVDAGQQQVSFRPRALVLPSGQRVPVRPAGLRPDGSLAVPDQVSEVGWWTGGALAGEPYGGTVIAGHVDSRVQGIGAMAELRRVAVGDTVTLAAGRTAVSYRIRSVSNVPQTVLAEGTDVFDQRVPHRLVLITCGGPFDRATRRYTENVVAIAEPVRAAP